MSQTKIMSAFWTLGVSVLGGGIVLGNNFNKTNALCDSMITLEKDHDTLKEKVYDIHARVCVIDEKLNQSNEILRKLQNG